METYNPDTLQRLARFASSEFGRWYDEDYFPSHEEISHAMSLYSRIAKQIFNMEQHIQRLQEEIDF